jgi:hypothetical protein
VRERLSAGDPQDITYAAGEARYYQLSLDAATEYAVTLENAEATWVLYAEDGTQLATSGTYTTVGEGYYYLVVTATAATTENATIAVAPVEQVTE